MGVLSVGLTKCIATICLLSNPSSNILPSPILTSTLCLATLCPSLYDPMDCSLQNSLLMDYPGQNTGVGCHFLLQGIFPTQESNPGLLHCRQILYQLSYEGSPKYVVVDVN